MSEEQPRGRQGEEEDLLGLLPDFLLDPIGAARRRWVAMAACFVVGLVVTAVAYASWKPVYQAFATVLITDQKISDELVPSTVPNDTLDNVNAMVNQVLSVESLSRLIDELDLFPNAPPQVRRIDLVNRLRSNVDHEPLRTRTRRRDAALVYGIAYTDPDPGRAAAVTNALAALFVEESFSRRNQLAQQTTAFLRQELKRDEEELRRQSSLIAEFRRTHRGELPEELSTNLRKLDMLAARRESINFQISEKESRILSITARGGDAPLTEDEILLRELRRELARESAVHTDEHPNVIALRDRIARLERGEGGDVALSPSQKAIIDAERRDIDRLREQAVEIDRTMAELNARVDSIPKVSEELSALLQREQVMREDYLSVLRKVEAAELAESLESARQGGQVSVLDAAQRPGSPLRPRWIVAAGGVAGSLLLALAAAVLLELLDPVFVGTRQIERMSNRPVLGTLPDVV